MEEFEIRDGVLERYKGRKHSPEIPEEVKALGDMAFFGCQSIRRIRIPDTVRSIGRQTFSHCEKLEKVELPDSLTEIGDGAFAVCPKLADERGFVILRATLYSYIGSDSRVQVPQGVRRIGQHAFRQAHGMEELILPEGLEEICDTACGGQEKLRAVHFPQTLRRIGPSAFLGCPKLEEVLFPDGLEEIGDSAFRGCQGLRRVRLPEGTVNIQSSAFSNCTGLKDERDMVIVAGCLFDYVGQEEVVRVPDGVRVIGVGAFTDNRSPIVRMSSLGQGTFSGSNLRQVVLPESVEEIQRHAFFNCDKLKYVNLPGNLRSLASRAFAYCTSLEQVELPESLVTLDAMAFDGCENLRMLKLPASLKDVKYDVLMRSMPAVLDVPDIQAVPAGCRPRAAAGYAILGEKGPEERRQAFLQYMKKNTTRLLETAMTHPELLRILCREGMISPQNVDRWIEAAQKTGDPETIAMMIQYQAERMTEEERQKEARRQERQDDAVFRRMVNRIESPGIRNLRIAASGKFNFFPDRDALRDFIQAKGGTLAESVSTRVDLLVSANPEGTDAKTRKARELGLEILNEEQFIEKASQEIPGYLRIRDGVLERYIGIGGPVEIPAEVQTIGPAAFKDCSGVTDVHFLGPVPKMEWAAFRGCSGLADERGFVIVGDTLWDYCGPGGDVVLPEGVRHLDEEVFQRNTDLTSVTLPEGLKSLAKSCFLECTGLERVVLPKEMEELDSGLFAGCRRLQSVTLPERLKKIPEGCFRDCESLLTLRLPEDLETIGPAAFLGCRRLRELECPETLKTLGESAFFQCGFLKRNEVLMRTPRIGRGAFLGCTAMADQEGFVVAQNTLHDYSGHADTVTVPEGIQRIGIFAFSGSRMRRVILPPGTLEIDNQAFQDCTELEQVDLPEGLKMLQYMAFRNCPKLKELRIPESVKWLSYESCGGPNTVLIGAAGSYAEQYAKQWNLPFRVEEK